MPEVKKERNKSRDATYSIRHRLYGWDCPACDIDFVEYDVGRPVAVTEMETENANPANKAKPTEAVKLSLANGVSVPYVRVRHAVDLSWFEVAGQRMPEVEWVRMLYDLRNRGLPGRVQEALLHVPVTRYVWRLDALRGTEEPEEERCPECGAAKRHWR